MRVIIAKVKIKINKPGLNHLKYSRKGFQCIVKFYDLTQILAILGKFANISNCKLINYLL